ncbi:hypothetical protein SAMN05444166_4981 [Singulisphaera sp. GP187]|nr:hypothetical protein SAMN05444166_4981 [Singulisphaera sp. GP187]
MIEIGLTVAGLENLLDPVSLTRGANHLGQGDLVIGVGPMFGPIEFREIALEEVGHAVRIARSGLGCEDRVVQERLSFGVIRSDMRGTSRRKLSTDYPLRKPVPRKSRQGAIFDSRTPYHPGTYSNI